MMPSGPLAGDHFRFRLWESEAALGQPQEAGLTKSFDYCSELNLIASDVSTFRKK